MLKVSGVGYTKDCLVNGEFVLDASDILESKLSQLQSLLSCCYGDGGEWFEVIGARHRDNIMWIAADLATEVTRLSQEILKGNHAMDLPKDRGHQLAGAVAHGDPHGCMAPSVPGESRARK